MSDDKTTGYANPPLETRWKPGQSGNPGGRKPGRSFRAAFLRAANTAPKLHPSLMEDAQATQIDQVLAKLFEKGMKGHEAAMKELLALSRALMPDTDDDESAAPDAAEDAAPGPCKADGNG